MTRISPVGRRTAAAVAAVLGVAFLFGWVRWLGPFSAPAGVPSDDAGAAGGVVCYGIVDLKDGVTSLVPLQAGRVVEVLVRESQAVSAGTALVRLDDSLARSRLAEATAQVEAVQLQLRQARKLPEQHKGQLAQQRAALEAATHRLAAARHEATRKKRLAKANLIDADTVAVGEEQVLELKALERVEAQRLADLRAKDPQADVQRVEKELAAAQARCEQARLALRDCCLKAPRAGTVLRLSVAVGDVLGPAATSEVAPAALFAADGPQVVRAEVEQEFARRIKEGQPAVVQDEADATLTWRGRVERVASWYSQRRMVLREPDRLRDTRTLECLVVVEPGQPLLRLGERVRVLVGQVPR